MSQTFKFVTDHRYMSIIATYVVFPDPLGPIIAFIPGLIMALKII